MGPEEVANGQVAVKNLTSGEQVSVARDLLIDAVKKILNA
jgi:histidyl-tRNA synthetase